MKKFFALVLALVMALSLMTVAWGAPTAEETALQTDLNAGGTVTLSGDVVVNDGLTVPANTTVVLDLNGHTISGTDTTSASYGLINIKPGATLTINDSVGTGTITLSATTNRGWGGYSSVISNQRGTLVVNGGTIEHKGGTDMSYAIDNLTNTGAEPAKTTINGGVIKSTYIGIRQFCNSTTGNNALEINGGTIEGVRRSVWMQNPNSSVNDATLTITDGTFVGALTADIDDFDVAISGGTFNTDVSEYVVDGMQLLANGTVVTTPAAGATDPVLYVADNSAAGWATYYIATGADLDDLKQGADENCLPCYLIDGEYFVEVNAAAGAYKLVYGATTVYLKAVPSTAVCYSAKASALKVVDADDAVCGDYYVTALDEDDVYYASYNKKGVVTGIYKAAKTGFNVLVNGKLVVVEDVTAVVEQLKHDWKGYDVVNYEYTTVKCANCGKVAPLFANSSAAGKDAFKVVVNGDTLGWITKVANDFTVAGTPSTDKTVTSAETFDAGIAMYVGMSVMAAAGSVVVLKKRED